MNLQPIERLQLLWRPFGDRKENITQGILTVESGSAAFLFGAFVGIVAFFVQGDFGAICAKGGRRDLRSSRGRHGRTAEAAVRYAKYGMISISGS